MESEPRLKFAAANLSYAEAIKLTGYMHAAHCCIYAKNPYVVMGKYPIKASIMMQNRFDGSIGFPGGLINRETDVLQGLTRELVEEINLDTSKYCISESDHVCAYVNETKKNCFHLYKLQVSPEELLTIEKRVFGAKEYAHETMGFVRVPLFTMECGIRGFPTFLCNSFAGNARDQLLFFILQENIMNEVEILKGLDACKKIQVEKCS